MQKITNRFIKNRRESDLNVLFDTGLFCSIWAKNYLSCDFVRLLEQIKEIHPCKYDLERRVPKLYSHLADCIYQIAEMGGEFIGLKMLSAGLFADCILMHLRMQVLECIHSLDKQQRDMFIKDVSETGLDMPLQELELTGKEILITKVNMSLNSIFISLLKAKSEEKGIKYITHLGWMALLAKVCEIDKDTGYIVGNTTKRVIHREKIVQSLHKVCQILKQDEKPQLTVQLEYPFEDMEEMLILWTRDNVNEILKCLKRVDQYYGIKAVRAGSDRMFGGLLQLWESEMQQAVINESKNIEDVPMQQKEKVSKETEEYCENKNTENIILEQIEKISGDTEENIVNDMKDASSRKADTVGRFYKDQRKMWKGRGNNRFFCEHS